MFESDANSTEQNLEQHGENRMNNDHDALSVNSQDQTLPVLSEQPTISRNGNSAYSAYSAGHSGGWGMPVCFQKYSVPSFPIHSLPEPIRDFVEAVSETTQTPSDLAAMIILATCAASVAKKYKVQGMLNWLEPLNLYTIVALPPGSRKSVVFSLVTEPLRDFQRDYNEQKAHDIAVSRAIKRRLEQQLRILTARVETPPDMVIQAQIELENHQELFPLRLMVDDVTPEVLVSLLQQQKGRIALMSAEGGFFHNIAGRYNGNIPTLDTVLKGHAGDELSVDRIGRPTEHVHDPALTIGLAVQPDVLRGLVHKPGFRDRGFLARFLYSLPPDNIGSRRLEVNPIPQEVANAYHRLVKSLLWLPDDQAAKTLILHPDADAPFLEFREFIENSLRPDAELGEARDWGGKLCGAVLRIAGILHLCIHGDANHVISQETIRNAIEIGNYLTAHMKAAFEEMGTDEQTDNAKKILNWIERHPSATYSRRDIFNGVRSSRMPQVDTLIIPLQRLCDMGYLREKERGIRLGPGRQRSQEYDVHPCLLPPHITQNTQNTFRLTLRQVGQAHTAASGRRAGHPNQTSGENLGN